MKEIYLIRHAQSTANAGYPTSYPDNIPLTELGKEQARLLATNRTDSIDLIIYSKFIRTYETAKSMMERFSEVPHFESPLIHEFTYLDPERFINTTTEQRKNAKDKFWNNDDLFSKDGAGSESTHEFLTRVYQFAESIKELPPQRIAVFSHGQYIRMLVDVLKYPKKQYTKKEVKRILFETDDVKNCGSIDITPLLQ